MLPGDELMWVRTAAEMRQLRAEGLRSAIQSFCYAGASPLAKVRKPLSPQQQKIFNLARVGWSSRQICNRLNIPMVSVTDGLHKIKHNGWEI